MFLLFICYLVVTNYFIGGTPLFFTSSQFHTIEFTLSKIEANNNSESKVNDSSQVPDNPLQAIFHVIWPPNTIWKKVVLGIVILLVVCFAFWATLPDETKKDIIHVFWGTVEQNMVNPLR